MLLASEADEASEESEEKSVETFKTATEEEYGEEFSIQDLEFFIEITEFWENILGGKTSIKELIKAKKTRVKPKPKRRKRK